MRRGLGFHARHSPGGAFSPLSLFTGGVQGAWYDPSDATTLFSDRAGTTPCGTPGQGSVVPVGLMLDKSQGLVLGSETVTNGDFSGGTTTGWTPQSAALSVVGGQLSVVPSTAFGYASQTLTTVVGTTYKITFDYNQSTAAFARYFVGTSLGGDQLIALTTASGVGSISRYFTATTTTTFIHFGAQNSSGLQALFDNISVRALPGNHAIAANDTTARPELRAVVNLLNGSATLATQSVTTVATTYTLYFTGSGSITLSGTATGTYAAGSSSVVCTAGTLTLTVSGTVTTADLRPANSGAQLPVYQARTDANTYDAVGFPRYLACNGTSSAMSTPGNVNLSGTDKVTVFAGVRKLAEASYPTIVEFSVNSSVNTGSFSAYTSGSSTPRYPVYLFGTASTGYEPQTYAAPISNVLAVGYDIGAADRSTEVIPRINGVVNQTNPVGAAAAGTGNFGSYPLFIGARNNSSLFLNGNIYSLIVVGSAVSAGQISATEQWVAQRTGIVI